MTVSKFLTGGEDPKELEPDAPYTWIFEENAAKSLGKFWSDFRAQSVAFTTACPETYADLPSWDMPFEKIFTPFTIEMEKTPTSFGIVHGDAHAGNIEMQETTDGSYDVSLLDFD